MFLKDFLIQTFFFILVNWISNLPNMPHPLKFFLYNRAWHNKHKRLLLSMPCSQTKIGSDTETLLQYFTLWYITSSPVVSESLLHLYCKIGTLLFAWIIRTLSLKGIDRGWRVGGGVAWYSSSDTLNVPTQYGVLVMCGWLLTSYHGCAHW